MMDFETIETEIVETLVDCGGVDEEEVHPWSRLVEDLRFDSIDLLDLFFRLEEHFEITLPVQSPGPVLKSVFTRKHFRVSDLVEMVYLQLGTGRPARRERSRWSRQENEPVAARASTSMFTQLGGRLSDVQQLAEHQFTPIDSRGPLERYRRFRDGMVCVRIPAGSAVIGCDHGQADEGPAHTVEFDSFVIDTEAVATTAYCRFLNSISVDDAQVRTWVALERDDHHADFTPIAHVDGRWRPRDGASRWPMTNVSWYGAAAYSLWVNGLDWRLASDGVCCLPTESQWERAATGGYSEEGEASSTIVAGVHEPGRAYDFAELPFAAVNEDRGVSDFGLRHAAGNVWEWCRDWYAPDFYRSPDASRRNAENTTETGVRCERGGSWVGPLELCRPTYRRGREPSAVGRCLGFRCVTVMEPTS